MCGDGANDAPALRQAQIGIAVSTATDVAKSAAGMVLTEPGLSGIVWPPFWNALTSLYLSSGRTPAKTANCSGRTLSGIGPAGLKLLQETLSLEQENAWLKERLTRIVRDK
jgi:hypothetical protein